MALTSLQKKNIKTLQALYGAKNYDQVITQSKKYIEEYSPEKSADFGSGEQYLAMLHFIIADAYYQNPNVTEEIKEKNDRFYEVISYLTQAIIADEGYIVKNHQNDLIKMAKEIIPFAKQYAKETTTTSKRILPNHFPAIAGIQDDPNLLLWKAEVKWKTLKHSFHKKELSTNDLVLILAANTALPASLKEKTLTFFNNHQFNFTDMWNLIKENYKARQLSLLQIDNFAQSYLTDDNLALEIHMFLSQAYYQECKKFIVSQPETIADDCAESNSTETLSRAIEVTEDTLKLLNDKEERDSSPHVPLVLTGAMSGGPLTLGDEMESAEDKAISLKILLMELYVAQQEYLKAFTLGMTITSPSHLEKSIQTRAAMGQKLIAQKKYDQIYLLLSYLLEKRLKLPKELAELFQPEANSLMTYIKDTTALTEDQKIIFFKKVINDQHQLFSIFYKFEMQIKKDFPQAAVKSSYFFSDENPKKGEEENDDILKKFDALLKDFEESLEASSNDSLPCPSK